MERSIWVTSPVRIILEPTPIRVSAIFKIGSVAFWLSSMMIILLFKVRPAIEAGEKLGFLPGDLQEKVDPYLKPLYDALNDVFGPDQAAKLRERGIIEVAPLAYMRGRTLNNSMIIIDESHLLPREIPVLP